MNDLMGQTDSQDLPQAQVEKMVSQSEVNRAIGAAKHEARMQAEAEFQKKLAELQQSKAMAEARGEDTRDINVDAVYQQVHERMQKEFQQKQLQSHFEQKSTAYLNKIENGRKTYDDFDTVMEGFNPQEFPQLVYLVADMDNAADIMYELSKDPKELAAIDYLSQRSPRKAQEALKKISDSIANNRAVLNAEMNAQTKSPLDRLTPSATSTGNGKMSIADYRNQPWMR